MMKLAKELNLSVSTVSKALLDSYEISAATKQRVIELAKKYNYKPNPFASSLRKGKSKFIAVIIPEVNNNFFSLVMDGIQTLANEKGYDVLVYLTHESHSNEISVLDHLEISHVDGIIMSLCSQTLTFEHIVDFHAESHLPLVFFDRIATLDNFPRIVTNNYESAFQATMHLFSQKVNFPNYLYTSEWNYINRERHRGFKDAVIQNGIEFTDEFVIKCTEDPEINRSIIRDLLLSEKPPDAIFTSIEKLAINVYEMANELKVKIPDRLKVISFSNLRTASLLAPSLSTISQPAFEMGEQAAKVLFKMIEKKSYRNSNDIFTINSTLNLRDSTKKN